MEAIVSSFESEVAAPLSAHAAGSSVLIAVSGGADSTALLLSLAALRHDLSLALHCVHIDHGIRSEVECRDDASAVLRLSRRLSVPASRYRIPRGRIAAMARSAGGIEAAARRWRHDILKRERRRVGARWIALGHTRDDALEHVLIRFFRGAGPAGLAALPCVNDPIIRPLIGLSRSRVEAYLAARGTGYRTDSTNLDLRYFRNLVRAKLVPFLDDTIPTWRTSVPALAETQALAARALSEGARDALRWEAVRSGPRMYLRVRAETFFRVPLILREEALYAALGELSRTFPQSKAAPIPRRRSLRLFADGLVDSLDLRTLRIDRRGAWIEVSEQRPVECLGGFSLLVEKSGFYELSPDLGVDVRPADGSMGLSGSLVGFAASIPAVLRSSYPEDRLFQGGRLRRIPEVVDRMDCPGYTDIIVVEDVFGIAALILSAVDSKVILIASDEDGGPRHLLFSVLARR